MLKFSVAFVWCLTISFAYAFLECPPISNGFYPHCECKYGPAYDQTTNTCPNPECPPTSLAQPSYPNCNCTEANFSYSEYVNECFRVCPENSTGYYPNCTCDDKLAFFNINDFKCIKCPEDSTADSIYPYCNCEKVGRYSNTDNVCLKCFEGSTGFYPNCTCNDEKGFFNEYYTSNECVICPPNTTGKAPFCICDNGKEYDLLKNDCGECPPDSIGYYPYCDCMDGVFVDGAYYCSEKVCPPGVSGTYPNCVCDRNATYIKETGLCMSCPSESTGIYPSCVCQELVQYHQEQNVCSQCPENSDGIFPNCVCKNGLYNNITNVCLECPVDSKGVYPNCVCVDKNATFDANGFGCYVACKGGSIGPLHPFCHCSGEMYYKADEFQCKSNTGRECPPAAFGIPPHCRCIRKNDDFDDLYWNCIDKAHHGSQQLSPANIDPNALKSLLG